MARTSTGGLGETGDSCSIDLPDGLKEPGTRDANGNCCSVLHAGKCQDSKGTITTKLTLAR